MPVYMISVTCVAALIGIILSLIFYRLKRFNFLTAAAITMASLVTALIMPGVLSLIYSTQNNAQDPSMSAILAAVSVFAYLVLILVLSIVIALVLPKIKIGNKIAALPESGAGAADTMTSLLSDTGPAEMAEAAAELLASSEEEASILAEPISEAVMPFTPEAMESFDENDMDGDLNMSPGDNYIEDIFLKFVGRNDDNSTTIANNEENEGFEENSEEKSVDSTENIDKMGIENNIHDNDIMTIEECIDEAFRLREAGDFEGSILYYMYAIDKKPQKELTFWIILDICVMYRSLGQQDLALDILNGYYDIYGDEMDGSVKEEIVRNLTEFGA